jgi:hypothetical protein
MDYSDLEVLRSGAKFEIQKSLNPGLETRMRLEVDLA